MAKPLQGVGYDLNSTNKGFSLDIHQDYTPDTGLLQTVKLKPFDCIIDKVGTANRLKVKKGTVTYHWAVTDLGYIGEGGLVPYFYDITKYNLFPTGTKIDGSDANSDYLNDGGYITLSGGNDYVVFVYMLGPFYQVENPSEFHVPQLCISKIGDYPEENISDVPNTAGRSADVQPWLSISEAYQNISYKYTNTFSLRANIARIKWTGGINGKFIIEQITNYPNMKFVPNIMGGGNTETTFDDSTVNGISGTITGYTKDLNADETGYDAIAQGEL